jgi:hypothetical protein
MTAMEAAMTDWWNDTDLSILECLKEAGPMSPGELARRVGISEGEASAFLCLLVTQGKVRIRLAELGAEQAPAMTDGLEFAGIEGARSWDDRRAARPVRATRRSRPR